MGAGAGGAYVATEGKQRGVWGAVELLCILMVVVIRLQIWGPRSPISLCSLLHPQCLELRDGVRAHGHSEGNVLLQLLIHLGTLADYLYLACSLAAY